MIHENAHYYVIPNEDNSAYVVVNKGTGVIEYTTQQLPEAINQAEHSSVFLSTRMWEWIRKQGEAAREELDSEMNIEGIGRLNS